MRKLYLKIHPDLIRNFPKEATLNEKSFQELMNFFTTIKESAAPPKQSLSLPFFLRTEEEGIFLEAVLGIKTSGGMCHKLVGTQLSTFFKEVGLPSDFEWGEDYWVMNQTEREDRDWSPEEMEAIQRMKLKQMRKSKDFTNLSSLKDEIAHENQKQEEKALAEIIEQVEPSRERDGLWGDQHDFQEEWGRHFICQEEGDEEMKKLDLV
jgi:hypothetical protein